MGIHEIREAFKAKLTKDSSVVRGDNVVQFVSFPALKEYVDTNIPKGTTYNLKVSTHPEHPINVVVGEVFFQGKPVHSEEFAMGLHHSPMDSVGLLTMVKKAILMSMFDIVPDDSSKDLEEITDDIFAAAVKVGKEHGYAKVIQRLTAKYNLPAETQLKLKKAIEAKPRK